MRNAVITAAVTAVAIVGGVSLTACGSSSAAESVTVQDMRDWEREFTGHETVQKLAAEKSKGYGVKVDNLQDVRDNAPNAPYADKEFDKVLAGGQAFFRAASKADGAFNDDRFVEAYTGLLKAGAALNRKVEAKFPGFTTEPSPWVQGQNDNLPSLQDEQEAHR